ncbi:MAG: hypothetical protein OEM67_09045 [Thermoleophilia bacterium]|nr:hypothetical protein [Thermoleophilia bacterium]MDH3724267.1 hypothetical protein [Thermoleophilia bacterium]
MSDDPWETWEAQFERERQPRRRQLRPTDYLLMAGVAIVFLLGSIIIIGGALVIEPQATQSTSEWRLSSSEGGCRATDTAGHEFNGQLTNLSDTPRDFRVSVAFEVDRRRVAQANQSFSGVAPGDTVIVAIRSLASFPDELPDVTCRTEVRHSAAS